ncbi:hypothetical protein JW935_24365 [candidate division KSB1 bacterium]|nr:hypothetical protein [candidate division KSB1 bacterium]
METAVELYPVSKDALLGTNRLFDLISIYIRTGRYDDALDQMTYLLSIRSSYSVHYYRLTPTMDALREHPRFQRLTQRYMGE